MMTKLYLGLIALSVAGNASSSVDPNSLRLVKTTRDVVLSWSGDGSPAGVYRAESSQGITDAANYVDASVLEYNDARAGLPGDAYYYQLGDVVSSDPIPAELAGNPLSQYPYFDYVRAFNVDAPVEVAIDPFRFPDIDGRTCDVYVTASRTAAQWRTDAQPDGRAGSTRRTHVHNG